MIYSSSHPVQSSYSKHKLQDNTCWNVMFSRLCTSMLLHLLGLKVCKPCINDNYLWQLTRTWAKSNTCGIRIEERDKTFVCLSNPPNLPGHTRYQIPGILHKACGMAGRPQEACGMAGIPHEAQYTLSTSRNTSRSLIHFIKFQE